MRAAFLILGFLILPVRSYGDSSLAFLTEAVAPTPAQAFHAAPTASIYRAEEITADEIALLAEIRDHPDRYQLNHSQDIQMELITLGVNKERAKAIYEFLSSSRRSPAIRPKGNPSSHRKKNLPTPVYDLQTLKDFYKLYGKEGMTILLQISQVQLHALAGADEPLRNDFMNGHFDSLTETLAPSRVRKLLYSVPKVTNEFQLREKASSLMRQQAPADPVEHGIWLRHIGKKVRASPEMLKRFEENTLGLAPQKLKNLIFLLENEPKASNKLSDRAA